MGNTEQTESGGFNLRSASEEEREYLRRASAAWLHGGEQRLPDPRYSAVVTVTGKQYVVLVDSEGGHTLAVYRVGNSGKLRRLRRPPRQLAELN